MERARDVRLGEIIAHAPAADTWREPRRQARRVRLILADGGCSVTLTANQGRPQMDTQVRSILRKLAALEPLRAPEGEPGVTRLGAPADARYIPVLSVYLDWRPEAHGERPGARAARVLLRDRLHEIEQAFWPRGAAYDAAQADAARIERYLDEQAAPSAEGLAIFACGPLGLFETLEAGVPFQTEVTALAMPNLYPLARLLDDQEAAVVVVADSNTARLFVSQRGLLREMKGLNEDPKFFRAVKGAVAMDQAHYQRYAQTQRRHFAEDVAQQIDKLVKESDAAQVILAGDDSTTAMLKAALTPDVLPITQAIPLHMAIDTPRDEVWEEVEPIMRAVEAEQERTVIERLLSEALAGRLGVVGLEQTRAALEMGQVDTLVMLADAPLTPERRSELISLASQSDAETQIVEASPELARLGGVGALLRYRISPPPSALAPPAPEPPGAHPTA
jgi:hypothetical protein